MSLLHVYGPFFVINSCALFRFKFGKKLVLLCKNKRVTKVVKNKLQQRGLEAQKLILFEVLFNNDINLNLKKILDTQS